MLDRSTYLVGDFGTSFVLDGNTDPFTLPSPDRAWYRIRVVSEN